MILYGFCLSNEASWETVMGSVSRMSSLFSGPRLAGLEISFRQILSATSIKSLHPFGSKYPRSKFSKFVTKQDYHKKWRSGIGLIEPQKVARAGRPSPHPHPGCDSQ